MKNFKVIEFRYARTIDDIMVDFNFDGVWSRPYEYTFVLNFIKKYNISNYMPNIHNSSWGYEGVHILFREKLDKIGKCTHSDILISKNYDTIYYDIVKENIDWFEKFDIVINVSTIEHLNTNEERRENHNIMDKWFIEINKLAKKYTEYEFILPIHPNPNVQKFKYILENVNVISPFKLIESIDNDLQTCAKFYLYERKKI